ncbi:hypothetical protein FB597_102428 [Herbaspirillum sp. SJZ099]|nr:hypothetical protein FB597_102428 [Herbaspirillum sp. SJZ099]
MTLQDAMDRAIGEWTLYGVAMDWDMPYQMLSKYVRGDRVSDAQTL